jgi:hypothetical protein
MIGRTKRYSSGKYRATGFLYRSLEDFWGLFLVFLTSVTGVI